MKEIDEGLHNVMLDRFLRYVRIDTQSSVDAPGYPSTKKQLDLLQLLASELASLGLADAALDAHGYVAATLPSSLDPTDPRAGRTPVIGLLAHVDTSPSVTGANVRPQVVRDYQGGDIALPGDATQIIRAADYPELAACIGHDLITTDGTTLLGADDKAGVAEIMTALSYLVRHPEVARGTIRVAFTPDEEVGRGTEHFEVGGFGANYAYTVDGSTAGQIEDETFCADTVKLTIRGCNVHPGYAKGKMVNSLKLAGAFLTKLPRDSRSPETTEGRQGYVHPDQIEGNVEETRLTLIVRDFSLDGLRAHEEFLRELAAEVTGAEPRASFEFLVEESYRNIKLVLDQHPQVVANAEEAIRRAGLAPLRCPIRGGTDGARLSFAGLPTANLFAGGHAFHSKQEWISLQDMGKAVETIIHLVQIWAAAKVD